SSPAVPHHHTRPLDAFAIAVVIVLCLSWGFNNVSVKVALHDIPPMIQCAVRSVVAALIVGLWAKMRGIRLTARDGTLVAGVLAGLMFAVEFILIYRGLVYTTAVRGTRIFLPADRFHLPQWAGLAMSFAGMAVAFGLPTPALDPRQTLGDVM